MKNAIFLIFALNLLVGFICIGLVFSQLDDTQMVEEDLDYEWGDYYEDEDPTETNVSVI
jgi:hypothetical protein